MDRQGIHRRADGSIDIARHAATGLDQRSEAARAAARAVGSLLWRMAGLSPGHRPARRTAARPARSRKRRDDAGRSAAIVVRCAPAS
jgi:hypothetical protein